MQINKKFTVEQLERTYNDIIFSCLSDIHGGIMDGVVDA